jgi:hypothetical protein
MVLDAAGTVKSLLSDNWDKDNTDNKTPTFSKVYEVKEVSLAIKSYILVYNTGGGKPTFNGTGSSNLRKDYPLTIDIRSVYDPSKDSSIFPLSTVTAHEHSIKLVEEVERIIKANYNSPGGSFEIIIPQTFNDLSDRRKKIFRHTYEIVLRVTND